MRKIRSIRTRTAAAIFAAVTAAALFAPATAATGEPVPRLWVTVEQCVPDGEGHLPGDEELVFVIRVTNHETGDLTAWGGKWTVWTDDPDAPGAQPIADGIPFKAATVVKPGESVAVVVSVPKTEIPAGAERLVLEYSILGVRTDGPYIWTEVTDLDPDCEQPPAEAQPAPGDQDDSTGGTDGEPTEVTHAEVDTSTVVRPRFTG